MFIVLGTHDLDLDDHVLNWVQRILVEKNSMKPGFPSSYIIKFKNFLVF